MIPPNFNPNREQLYQSVAALPSVEPYERPEFSPIVAAPATPQREISSGFDLNRYAEPLMDGFRGIGRWWGEFKGQVTPEVVDVGGAFSSSAEEALKQNRGSGAFRLLGKTAGVLNSLTSVFDWAEKVDQDYAQNGKMTGASAGELVYATAKTAAVTAVAGAVGAAGMSFLPAVLIGGAAIWGTAKAFDAGRSWLGY